MRTKYYCAKCRVILSEERIPNANKIHRACGAVLRIIETGEKEGTGG